MILLFYKIHVIIKKQGDIMKTDKLIIFDWGGVIESHDDKENSIKKLPLLYLRVSK